MKRLILMLSACITVFAISCSSPTAPAAVSQETQLNETVAIDWGSIFNWNKINYRTASIMALEAALDTINKYNYNINPCFTIWSPARKTQYTRQPTITNPVVLSWSPLSCSPNTTYGIYIDDNITTPYATTTDTQYWITSTLPDNYRVSPFNVKTGWHRWRVVPLVTGGTGTCGSCPGTTAWSSFILPVM